MDINPSRWRSAPGDKTVAVGDDKGKSRTMDAHSAALIPRPPHCASSRAVLKCDT